MSAAILLDLDETLVVDEPAAQASFTATAAFAATVHELDAEGLAKRARLRARELWHAAPTHPYCRRIGMSSWEGLWCRFEGDQPEVRALRAFSTTYRRQAWALALSDQDIRDDELAEELGERFAANRRSRHEVFADARPALAELAGSYRLALVTNGASCLQREKLVASGLSEYFDAVIASGDLGIGKPSAEIFVHACDQLAVEAEGAVMVGDNLERDVHGAAAAGLRGVWLNRRSCARPDGQTGVPEITTLAQLSAALRDRA